MDVDCLFTQRQTYSRNVLISLSAQLKSAGANSEFSFSKTSQYTKVKESSISYYLPITEWEIKGISTIGKANSRINDLDSGWRVNFLRG